MKDQQKQLIIDIMNDDAKDGLYKKQTAVEWLIEQVKSPEWQDFFIWHKEEAFEQAKAMHKEEIIQAWKKGDGEFDNFAKEMSLEYYNETFGGQGSPDTTTSPTK